PKSSSKTGRRAVSQGLMVASSLPTPTPSRKSSRSRLGGGITPSEPAGRPFLQAVQPRRRAGDRRQVAGHHWLLGTRRELLLRGPRLVHLPERGTVEPRVLGDRGDRRLRVAR